MGWSFINPANYHPYIPNNTGEFGHFGVSGIMMGAATIFFAYIGFDAVSTAAQECKNPQRDMPIGILGSLAVCTILYILFALVLTGMVNYKELGVAAPVAIAVDRTSLSVDEQPGEVRHHHGIHVGHPGDADGAIARVLLDVARRAGAESVFRDPPEVPDAVALQHSVLFLCGSLFGVPAAEAWWAT